MPGIDSVLFDIRPISDNAIVKMLGCQILYSPSRILVHGVKIDNKIFYIR